MAKELNGVYTPGTLNLYAILKLAGQMYNGSSFEDPLTANWGTYDLGLTESSSTGHYYADMPAGLSAGIYEYHLYVGNGTPDPTDPRFGFGVIYWDGTQDVGSQLLLSRIGTPVGASVSADIASIKTDTGTTLPSTLTAIQGATFNTSTDSLEAIRNRGDVAWATATGFSTLTQADIRDAVGLASANLDTQLAALAAYAASILDHTGSSGVVVASASKSGYSLSASGLDGITAETGVNLRQAVVIMGAALSGLLAGMGTGTITIKGMDSATTRITAVYDENNNRTSVTLNLPA